MCTLNFIHGIQDYWNGCIFKLLLLTDVATHKLVGMLNELRFFLYMGAYLFVAYKHFPILPAFYKLPQFLNGMKTVLLLFP